MGGCGANIAIGINALGTKAALWAGFFSAIARGKNPIDAMRAANDFGAKVAQYRGAHGHLKVQHAA